MAEKQFVGTSFAQLDSELDRHMMAAVMLLSEGYRQVSNGYKRVARVDISEPFLTLFLRKVLHWTDASLYWQKPGDWQDFYRRCYSKDVIFDVPEGVMKAMRSLADYRLPCFN